MKKIFFILTMITVLFIQPVFANYENKITGEVDILQVEEVITFEIAKDLDIEILNFERSSVGKLAVLANDNFIAFTAEGRDAIVSLKNKVNLSYYVYLHNGLNNKKQNSVLLSCSLYGFNHVLC